MAIIENGTISFKGAVIKTWDHYWIDGMVSEYALVWNIEKHEYETVNIGYYGSDGHDFIGIKCEVEVSEIISRDILKHTKKSAIYSFCQSVIEKKSRIEAGIDAVVVRGRKVQKGKKLNVFWVGERPTFTGYGTEGIAGCYDEQGNKIWIKADYLKNVTPLKSPTVKERKKYINWYIEQNTEKHVRRIAGWHNMV